MNANIVINSNFYMILKEILNRRSVREYKSDEVPEEFLNEIIKAAEFAPSGRGTHANEFLIVKEQKTKDEICKICGQEFLRLAPVMLILLCDSNKTDLVVQDLSVATENAFLQATVLGLGTVWKNLNSEWEEKIKKLLNIPQNYKAINIIPIGFPKSAPEPHSDANFSQSKIHIEKW
ncbi:MAG: nitroreductase family protein [Patescibacteria group bacterium]